MKSTELNGCAYTALALVLLVVQVFTFNKAQASTESIETITTSGQERLYYLKVPTLKKPKARPLVIYLHGGASNYKEVFEYVQLDRLAQRKKFFLVAPQSTGGGFFACWNHGVKNGCPAVFRNEPDVQFISDIIDQMIAEYPVDPSRIYVTGFSSGANMAYRVACDLSERVAAIAPVAVQEPYEDCYPTRAVPVMVINGTEDRLTPHEPAYIGAESWAVGFNNCSSVVEQDFYGCSSTRDIRFRKGDVTCEVYRKLRCERRILHRRWRWAQLAGACGFV